MAYFLEVSLDQPVASAVPVFATAKQTGTGFQQDRVFKIALPKQGDSKTAIMSDEDRAKLAQELLMKRQAQQGSMPGSDVVVSSQPLMVQETPKIFGLDRNIVIFGGIGAALLGVLLLKKGGMLGERLGPPPGVRMPAKLRACGQLKRMYDNAGSRQARQRVRDRARARRCAWPGR